MAFVHVSYAQRGINLHRGSRRAGKTGQGSLGRRQSPASPVQARLPGASNYGTASLTFCCEVEKDSRVPLVFQRPAGQQHQQNVGPWDFLTVRRVAFLHRLHRHLSVSRYHHCPSPPRPLASSHTRTLAPLCLTTHVRQPGDVYHRRADNTVHRSPFLPIIIVSISPPSYLSFIPSLIPTPTELAHHYRSSPPTTNRRKHQQWTRPTCTSSC